MGLLKGVDNLEKPEHRSVWIGLALDEIDILEVLSPLLESHPMAWSFLRAAVQLHFQPQLISWGLVRRTFNTIKGSSRQDIKKMAVIVATEMLDFEAAKPSTAPSQAPALPGQTLAGGRHTDSLPPTDFECQVRSAALQSDKAPALIADAVAGTFCQFQAKSKITDLADKVWNGFGKAHTKKIFFLAEEWESYKDIPSEEWKRGFLKGVARAIDEASANHFAKLIEMDKQLLQAVLPSATSDEVSLLEVKMHFFVQILNNHPGRIFDYVKSSTTLFRFIVEKLKEGSVHIDLYNTCLAVCLNAMNAESEISTAAKADEVVKEEEENRKKKNSTNQVATLHDKAGQQSNASAARDIAAVREEESKTREREVQENHGWMVKSLLEAGVVPYLVAQLEKLPGRLMLPQVAGLGPKNATERLKPLEVSARRLMFILRRLLLLYNPDLHPEGFKLTQKGFGVIRKCTNTLGEALKVALSDDCESLAGGHESAVTAVRLAVTEVTSNLLGANLQMKWWKLERDGGRSTEAMTGRDGRHRQFTDNLEKFKRESLVPDGPYLACALRWMKDGKVLPPLPEGVRLEESHELLLATAALLWNVAEARQERDSARGPQQIASVQVEPQLICNRWELAQTLSRIEPEDFMKTCFYKCVRESGHPHFDETDMKLVGERTSRWAKRLLRTLEEDSQSRQKTLVKVKKIEREVFNIVNLPKMVDVRTARLARFERKPPA
mmetsp:Transcript_5654/g.12272  ORF Transcript_5654/g.12272 Transcript_5654/m.12272 type:complete len:724 (+) Transcript_5654:3-2174(+)